MSFNPLEEKGMPIERQMRNWSELNVQPFDKNNVDPYTRTRVITMNGIEVESIIFSHQFARHTSNMDIRRYLAQTRRIEQQQQKAVNWLNPGDATPLETTIGYEQVAVDLTAAMARTEPDPYVKQALDFALLEDFDHLYRYANLLDMLEGKKADSITGPLTEIMPGRPTLVEHRHPEDDIRRPTNVRTSDPLSVMHIMTIVAAEQQTMNFYMNVGNLPENPLARGLYLEIAMIEEEHVSHYESLIDPTTTWFERDVLHQYNECYLYHSFMSQETDPRIRRLWELHLDMEIGQLHKACEMMKKYDKKDPAEMLPKALPEPTLFHENKEYVRQVLKNQVELTGNRDEYQPVESLPDDHRYFKYQGMVNSGNWTPSEEVIKEHVKQCGGSDYRSQVNGEHPVEWLREPIYEGMPARALSEPGQQQPASPSQTGSRRR